MFLVACFNLGCLRILLLLRGALSLYVAFAFGDILSCLDTRKDAKKIKPKQRQLQACSLKLLPAPRLARAPIALSASPSLLRPLLL